MVPVLFYMNSFDIKYPAKVYMPLNNEINQSTILLLEPMEFSAVC